MTNLPPVSDSYLLQTLVDLLKRPSPTGWTERAVAYVEDAVEALGLSASHTPKGALVVRVPGASAGPPRALTAHVDTLGAMVKAIKSNGRLRLTRIGGFAWNTVEGEECTVFTRSGREIKGSLLIVKASSHVYGTKEVEGLRRDDAHMEVRLDERTASALETEALGIQVGDFVAFSPRVVVSDSGFIRSRHLDDKAGVAAILAAVKALLDAGRRPSRPVILHFSNYEEVGHGASDLPADLAELVAVDMAAVGEGQTSDEFHVTICAKDSGGPYHHGLTSRLRDLAATHHIPHKVDIYPYYGSDGEAYWLAGGPAPIALIGPGVDASHNYERTHMEALMATARLILAYLLD